MVTKTESGLAIYAELKDNAGADVRVRRCHGNPPRVVIESTWTFEVGALSRSGPRLGPVTPELSPAMARVIGEALLTFSRRAGVPDDAGLPKKSLSAAEPQAEPRPGYAMGAP